MNTIASSDIEQRLGTYGATIISVAERLLGVLKSLPEFTDKGSGGYFSITYKTAEEVLLLYRIGIIPHQDDANPKFRTKAKKYSMLSLEKGTRLIRNAYTLDHLSSWQSRDEVRDEYGGAVWCDEFAVSFSGFPPPADEAFCLVMSIHFGWMTVSRAQQIAKISGNTCFVPLLLAWHEAGNAVPVIIP